MSNIIFLLLGLLLGASIYFAIFSCILVNTENLLSDYKKGILKHNTQEAKLTYILQSIKLYVKNQKSIIKTEYNTTNLKNTSNAELLAAGTYNGLCDIETKIIALEKETGILNN